MDATEKGPALPVLPVPIIGLPPPGRRSRLPDHIPPTCFASLYKSIFTLQEPVKPLLANIPHVNCSYLSTPGIAPTLLQLKQHAQSLAILIKYLTVNTIPGLINNAECEITGAPTFSDGESYDYLNDLSQAYTGPTNQTLERHHNMPLTALINIVEPAIDPNAMAMATRAGQRGQGQHFQTVVHQDVCPLHSAHPSLVADNQPSLPYATHQALIAHANEVLELLDHEYSAKGGLAGILPPKEDQEDRAKAESTLLGQWIVYLQRLMLRVHDLERQYANALDALKGEAAIPMQTLSRLGPDGRAPREMVYPQDRFVLVNAGEDVWNFLHKEFEKKEVVDEKVAEMYLKQGVSGEALWELRGGKEFSRGITTVDIVTRYYRLRKDPLKTVFVIPAYAQHPGTKVTREMEKQPSVVTIVKPVWPERASQWEMKHRAQLDELKTLRQEKDIADMELEAKRTAEKLLATDNAVKDGMITKLTAELARLRTHLTMPEHQTQRELVETEARASEARQAAEVAQRQMILETEALDAERTAFEAERMGYREEIQRYKAMMEARIADFDKERDIWRTKRDTQDKLLGEQARDLNHRMEAIWKPKMRDIHVLTEAIRRRNREVEAETVPQSDIVHSGFAEADRALNSVLDQWRLDHGLTAIQAGLEFSNSDSSMEGC
jgi:hypothetical protein